MAERLTLTTPESGPTRTTWAIVRLTLDVQAPALKATCLSNTGEERHILYVKDDDNPAVETQIRAALRFINNGTFQTQGKTLQRWLLERFAADGKLGAGSVTGTPD